MSTSLPFIDLKSQYAALREEINGRMQAVLDHGQYIMGPEVRELEEKLEAFSGAKHCITVASGTEALYIALLALNIGCGDEVITTPFTFAATVEVITLCGAAPVLIDIDPATCNMDASALAAAISPRTKAIIPVSLYGQCADMTAINEIAAAHGHIPVIEDAAQSFGATQNAKKSCALSTIGCTSFFPSKPLGCYGDGGAIFTSDDALAKAMREIRVHGQEKRYVHTRIGVGGRMDTLQCAVVLAKLTQFAWEINQRIALGDRYLQLLREVPGVGVIHVLPQNSCVWAQFTVRISARERVMAALSERGIPTTVHYPLCMHEQPAYKNLCRVSGSLKHAETAANEVMSLPMHPYLSHEDQERIVHALAQITSQSKAA